MQFGQGAVFLGSKGFLTHPGEIIDLDSCKITETRQYFSHHSA
jgi:hypothetical protein